MRRCTRNRDAAGLPGAPRIDRKGYKSGPLVADRPRGPEKTDETEALAAGSWLIGVR